MAKNDKSKKGTAKSGNKRLPEPSKRPPDKTKKELKPPKNPDSFANQIILVVIGLVGLLVGACLLLTDMNKGTAGLTGPVGYYISKFFYGMFGIGAFFIPIFTVVYAAMWKHSVREKKTVSKAVFMALTVAMISSLMHLVYAAVSDGLKGVGFYQLGELWKFSSLRRGGGIVGGFIGGGLGAAIKVIAWPVVIIGIVIFVMLVFELTPNMIAYLIRQSARRTGEKSSMIREKRRSAAEVRRAERAERRAVEEERREEERRLLEEEKEQKRIREAQEREKRKVEDIPIGGAKHEPAKRTISDLDLNEVFPDRPADDAVSDGNRASDIEGNDFVDFEQTKEDMTIVSNAPEPAPADKRDEDTEPAVKEEKKKESPREEEIDKVRIKREKAAPERVPEPVAQTSYALPPIDLLTAPDLSLPAGADNASLERNGRKLVETLRSFKVDVDIVNISQGPTITRYELVPKAGVRVRSIANLVDDIALSLETQGIRIEAPIPGKAAVGIEVPNKNSTTVHLRELIDSPSFRNAKSKLTCCLGKSVSGEPIYLDVAKMPHLLIAGATGMGKSVCINSLLMSLLYRATPDEVKLILIDPKKVEMNNYNKLPHLLVPVVSQPKMAAGSLAWAVTEMDRRFELIEEVGVRDIAGYNKVTEDDGKHEYMPQIVIVIDELADLMMTAPVDVETSICRLAQKARAAGMHLIIGTQRPSVDVITGLIKANIPSRIAFTVASNRDSMTIIDVAGAEKLIGRGDMLYNPVGAMKPMRVQGAFVSEFDVVKVTDFIKEQMSGSYDEEIIKEIDKNAKQCGVKKKSESADDEGGDEELDEKFWDAVEVAVEEGKISTSLLQRRLSLGYGRAAKIIDAMVKKHIVSQPDGQKPRTTLITANDLAEMKMRMSDEAPAYEEDDCRSESDGVEADGDRPFTEDDFDDDAPF